MKVRTLVLAASLGLSATGCTIPTWGTLNVFDDGTWTLHNHNIGEHVRLEGCLEHTACDDGGDLGPTLVIGGGVWTVEDEMGTAPEEDEEGWDCRVHGDGRCGPSARREEGLLHLNW